MRVLVVHYHLKPGGVTTVIKRQMAALKARGVECSLLLGETPPGEAPPGDTHNQFLEPALAYDMPDSPGARGIAEPERVDAIVRAVETARASLGGGDTIIHVHNPTLRKNSALLPALDTLASRNLPVLMHVHDLAEDWRPQVYSGARYPAGCAWACINGRDRTRLAEAGAGMVSLLPNAVFSSRDLERYAEESATGETRRPATTGGIDTGSVLRDTFLYPVRAIRRKNLGEALLLSLFLPDGARLAVTLPPNSARDLPYYEGWQAMAAYLKAPAVFGAGLEADLAANYARARAALTTSVKEGFGLSYLEPLMRGLPCSPPIRGRRIPSVCGDFEAEGLVFPGLYERIAIPADFYDARAMQARASDTARSCARAYSLEQGAEDIAGRLASLFEGEADFGRLDELAQAQVLRTISRDSGAMAALAELNPSLPCWHEPEGAGNWFRPTAEVLGAWSEERYGGALVNIYDALLEAKASSADLPPPDKSALLKSCIQESEYYAVGS